MAVFIFGAAFKAAVILIPRQPFPFIDVLGADPMFGAKFELPDRFDPCR
jgi:hypothetical protein